MKKCFKCGQIKNETEFYKHPAMGDGLLGKCKDCAKADVKERYDVLLATEPGFVESERLRGRDKYRRLYVGTRPSVETKNNCNINYANKFPEKLIAKNRCNHIKPPQGFNKHHWSYNEEHFKDVIMIPQDLHYRLHRYLTYDPQENKYRTTENTLLETREMHEQYIKIIQEIF